MRPVLHAMQSTPTNHHWLKGHKSKPLCTHHSHSSVMHTHRGSFYTLLTTCTRGLLCCLWACLSRYVHAIAYAVAWIHNLHVFKVVWMRWALSPLLETMPTDFKRCAWVSAQGACGSTWWRTSRTPTSKPRTKYHTTLQHCFEQASRLKGTLLLI